MIFAPVASCLGHKPFFGNDLRFMYEYVSALVGIALLESALDLQLAGWIRPLKVDHLETNVSCMISEEIIRIANCSDHDLNPSEIYLSAIFAA